MTNQSLRNTLKPLALVAAVGFTIAGCTLVPQLFPVANQHPDGWLTEHGREVLSLGPDQAKVANGMTCNKCHTTSIATGSTIPAPSKGSNLTCYSCHAGGPNGSPHSSDWKAAHGPFVVRSGGATESTITNAELGIKDQACATCHTIAKNTDGTITPSPKAKSTCFTCHSGGVTGTPHGDDWRQGHLKVAYWSGDQTCAECHTTTKDQSGLVPPSPKANSTCFTCHDLRADKSPHGDPAVWGIGGQHGKIAAKYGYSRSFVDTNGMPHEACTTCHTIARDSSGNIPPSPAASTTCFDCHEGPNGR